METINCLNIDHRYLRLNLLLNQKACSFLRNNFQETWTALEGKKWANCVENGERFIKQVGKKLYADAGKIQKKNLKQGNIFLWDLPLLLDSTFAVYAFFKGKKCNKISQKDAETLRQVRNKLAHLGTIEVEEKLFEELWTSVADILIKHGVPSLDIQEIKTGKLLSQGNGLHEDGTAANIVDAKALKEKGNVCFKSGNYVEAEKLYTKAIELPALPSEDLSILFSNRSATCLALGKIEDAKDDAKVANTLRPTWAKPYFRLGKAYEEKGNFKKGLIYFKLAEFYDPTLPNLLDEIATCKHEITKEEREEHLNPALMPFSDLDLNQGQLNHTKFKLPFQDEMKKEMYLQGHPQFICGEAHKYLHGIQGQKKDLEMAVTLFGKAAMKGSAEGMYNLALLTMDGNGVKRNPTEAVQLHFRAANMPPMSAFPPGSGFKMRTIGVRESQHYLGLVYNSGIVVDKSFAEAKKWYEKALENGCDSSANNLGMMYQRGELGFDLEKALSYFKVGSYLGNVRAMENAAMLLFQMRKFAEADDFRSLAILKGSQHLELDRIMQKEGEKPRETFTETEFRSQLEKQIMSTPMKKYIESKDDDLLEKFKSQFASIGKNFQNPLPKIKDMIINHRTCFKRCRTEFGPGVNATMNTTLPKLFPSPSRLAGLKEIFFKDFDPKIKDKVYDGFVIQLTGIEDAVFGLPSIPLLVQDEKGTVGMVYIYNYPQKKEVHDEFGFGCVFAIINPYYRLMSDRAFAIRVDDPNLIFKYPSLRKTEKLCRFCKKEEEAKVECRKCRRITYCSKACLKKDEEELMHHLVCFKKL